MSEQVDLSESGLERLRYLCQHDMVPAVATEALIAALRAERTRAEDALEAQQVLGLKLEQAEGQLKRLWPIARAAYALADHPKLWSPNTRTSALAAEIRAINLALDGLTQEELDALAGQEVGNGL